MSVRFSMLPVAVAAVLLAGAAAAQECANVSEGTALLADQPAVRAFYDAMTLGDPALADCALEAGWTNTPSAPGTPTGPEGFKPTVAWIGSVFSGYAFETQDVIVSGDRVVVRSLVTATQIAPFMGVPPADTPVTFQTIDIHQIGADGKIAASWHVEDWLTYLLMRGALPVAG